MVVFLVLEIISKYQSISQKEIIELTSLSERTVRYSLKRLILLGHIKENVKFYDLRYRFYSINKNGGDKHGTIQNTKRNT